MTGTPIFGAFAGGVGLFLLGLWLATDGVKLAGGSVLKANLRTWACNRWRSFETGFAIALLVPSSSASSRAAIGFVNCGLVSPESALWLAVGTSFGSVVTAWLVVAVGLSSNALALALSLVGAGCLLRWSGPHARRGAWGQAVAGLGVLFLGLAVLAQGFQGLAGLRLDALPLSFGARTLVLATVGALAAAALRSASATVAVAMVATATGAVSTLSGMAIVAGANLGAAAPALWALHGGTPAAKRLAVANVGFHAGGTVLGLFLLVVAFPFSERLVSSPFAIASHHLAFQVLASLALVPAATPLTRFLRTQFVMEEMDAGRPRRLDPHLLAVPDLAVEGVVEEVRQIGALARGLGRNALKGEVVSDYRLRQDLRDVDKLARAVDVAMGKLAQGEMGAPAAATLVELPRASRGFGRLCEAVARYRELARGGDLGLDPRLRTRTRQLQLAVLHLLESADPFRRDFSIAEAREELEAVERHASEVRLRLHHHCAAGRVEPPMVDRACARLDALERIAACSVEVAASLARVRDPFFDAGAAPTGVEETDATALQAVA